MDKTIMKPLPQSMEPQPQPQNKKICGFFMVAKKRECRLQPYKDTQFCASHQQLENMIPCSLDPNHLVRQDLLEKHLKICNVSKTETEFNKQIWFEKNINLISYTPPLEQQESVINPAFLQQIQGCFNQSIEIYYQYLQSVNEQTFPQIKDLKEYILDYNTKEDIKDTSISDKVKDQKQIDLLIQQMEKYKLINLNYCYIEFGAGKGHLSSEICQHLDNKSTHILLEIGSRKHVFDKLHKENPFYIRFKTDITHFNVCTLPTILQQKNYPQVEVLPVIGISKHMCGQATDLTINTLLNCKSGTFFQGMMIATCCHHACKKENYVNIQFLQDIGFSNAQIDNLFRVSAWFTTGRIKNSFKKDGEEVGESNEPQKDYFGYMAKRIIDIGRIMKLNDLGFRGTIVKYCDKKVSPENFIILIN